MIRFLITTTAVAGLIACITGSVRAQMSLTPAEETPVTRDGGSSRGVAWGDFDNDGDADLLVSNTDNQQLYLYRNSGSGRFERVTAAPFNRFRGYSEGVTWIDFDNDGWLDLFVARTDGPNVLFRNDRGSFQNFDAGALTSANTVSSEGCWADFDNDGWLDVFVANRNGQDDVLYRNISGKSFQALAGPFTGRGGDARTCAAGDANGDGRPDIYVGNFLDRSHTTPRKAVNAFYLNTGGASFKEVLRGHFVNTPSLTYGVSWVDFDQDGDLDLFVTNISLSDRNLLYENLGEMQLYPREDLHLSKDSLGPSKGHAWGDFDNDGDLDVIVAEGTEDISEDEKAQGYNTRNRLYANDGQGRFTAVQGGRFTADEAISAGVAWSDYDLDGDLDIAVANWGGNGENNDLFRNAATGNWIVLLLEGRRSNRQGIGAQVVITTAQGTEKRLQRRWLYPKTGYASMNEPVLHFGLGDATAVEHIEIHWPSGRIDEHGARDANARYKAVEGTGDLEPMLGRISDGKP